MIRAEEQEQRTLQRMIEALDERFPAAPVGDAQVSAVRRGRESDQA